jgi:RNA polymerase sigma factor (sigma-70 family)
MTPEELYTNYEKIVYKSLHEQIKYPLAFCKKKGFDMEDLEQYGRVALWNAALKCDNVESFGSYAYRAVAGAYKDLIFHMRPVFLIRLPYHNTHEEREEVVSYLSTDWEDKESGLGLLDALPSPNNVERHVVKKLELEDKLGAMTEKQAKYITAFISGYNTTEIAHMYGLRHQYGVSSAIKTGVRLFDPTFNISLRGKRISESIHKERVPV